MQGTRVLVSGSSGLIGRNLYSLLTTGGYDVTGLSRQPESSPEARAVWDTSTGRIQVDSNEPIDAVVHLAGESIAGRWSPNRKRRILESRVEGTRQLVTWMNRLDQPPRVFVCASAIGYYGDRGDESLTERSRKGTGFLSDVCEAWERAAEPARSDHTRVVHLRFGMVLSPGGGALSKMLTPFKMGGGGRIGSGRQYWSWISVDDAAGAVLHAMRQNELDGPVNVVSPRSVTNREFTKTLGRVLRRPTIAPMPGPVARLAFGEMADELLLSSQRVVPERLIQSQYRYRHADLRSALHHLLGRPASQHLS